MHDTAARTDSKVLARGGWLVLGLFAAAAAGCVTPARQAALPTIETLTPHDEPELVAEAAPPASEPQPAPAPLKHKVEPGQTLYRISRLYDLDVHELMAANGISDPRTLSVGQELIIPRAPPPAPASTPVVVPGAQQTGAVATVSESSGDIPEQSSSPAPAPKKQEAVVLPKGEGVLEWPLRGVLYARFGHKGRERHDGIDLAAPSGSPIKTARPGTVLYAGEQKGYGLIAIVDHGDDLITLYAHNRDLRVRTGQKVREGQVIATVGESGRTSGPHLHFEVRKGGVPQDPLRFLGAPPVERRALGRRSAEDSR